MTEQAREATLADLVEYAYFMRSQGYCGIYLYAVGAGTIKWSREKPPHTSRYCLIGPTGRIWNITDYENT